MKRCVSCGIVTENFVSFPCPVCGEKIIRCVKCRENRVEYVCPSCGFRGP
jgi:predicted RNA-binding Zn-ribbon protein involved in translation (DUF1610 family)